MRSASDSWSPRQQDASCRGHAECLKGIIAQTGIHLTDAQAEELADRFRAHLYGSYAPRRDVPAHEPLHAP